MELLFIIPLCKKERAFLPLFLALFKEDIALRFVAEVLECWSNSRLVIITLVGIQL